MLRHSSIRRFFPIIHRTLRTTRVVLGNSSQFPKNPDQRASISVDEFMSIKPVLPKFSKNFQEFDILRDAIRKSKSMNEILTIVRLNKDTMEGPQVNAAVSCLTRLRHAERDQNSRQSDEEILTNPEFQLLCKIIVERIRILSPQYLISCLLFVDTFNISIKTTLTQSILQLIRQRINDFQVSQICFLHATVVRIKQSHSIDDGLLNAVIVALPMVFEIKVANNLLDFNDTTTVISCIRFSIHHKLRSEIVNKLLNAADANRNALNSYECFHLRECLEDAKIANMDIDKDLAESLVKFAEEGAKAWLIKSENEHIP